MPPFKSSSTSEIEDCRSKLEGIRPIFLMTVSEFNEDTQDQKCDLLESLKQVEKLKHKDMRIFLDKVIRKYGGKILNK
tara:strand:+ start:236 stop:469 length:234 start_codon:yes stop_codon:yes gene_type:complete